MMNLKQIRALAKILENSGLSALEVMIGQDRVRLERQSQQTPPPGNPKDAGHPPSDPGKDAAGAGPASVRELKSPMVGIYFSAPSPGAEPFVSPGSRVKKGEVLCLVEAMKMMNEITADTEGVVAEICAENGQLVEFGQTLFKII